MAGFSSIMNIIARLIIIAAFLIIITAINRKESNIGDVRVKAKGPKKGEKGEKKYEDSIISSLQSDDIKSFITDLIEKNAPEKYMTTKRKYGGKVKSNGDEYAGKDIRELTVNRIPLDLGRIPPNRTDITGCIAGISGPGQLGCDTLVRGFWSTASTLSLGRKGKNEQGVDNDAKFGLTKDHNNLRLQFFERE